MVYNNMIETVELKNWKAFNNYKVSFKEGINFIVGPNGIGKSSILQAICVGFTGKLPDKGSDISYKHLIRNNSEDSQINIDFKYKNKEYAIKRDFNYSRTKQCQLLDRDKKGTLYSGSWNNLNKEIEKLFNLKTIFFDLLIYLSEGHVYRSIGDKSGKYILDDLNEILGITKVSDLNSIISQQLGKIKLDETALKNDLDKITKGGFREEKDIKKYKEQLNTINNKHDDLVSKRSKLTYDIFDNKNQIEKYKDVIKIKRDYDNLSNEIYLENEEYDKNKSILSDLQKDIFNTNVEKEVLNHNIISYNEIIKVLNIVSDKENYKNICPICNKLLTTKEKYTIIENNKNNILFSEKELKTLNKNISKINTNINNIKSIIEVFDKKINYMKSLENVLKKDDNIANLDINIKNTNKKLQILNKQKTNIDTEINNIANKIINIKSDINTYEKLSSNTKVELISKLESNNKLQYLLESTNEGLIEFVTNQRDSQLKNNLYKSLASIWDHFTKSKGWNISLNDDGTPILIDDNNKEYLYRYLSGGEKTAILVITKTILNNMLADDIGFLLIDEPLEHLDAINRRSLLQFLIDSKEQNLINQLIVTTTEASLLNRYINEKNVNFIYLE